MNWRRGGFLAGLACACGAHEDAPRAPRPAVVASANVTSATPPPEAPAQVPAAPPTGAPVLPDLLWTLDSRNVLLIGSDSIHRFNLAKGTRVERISEDPANPARRRPLALTPVAAGTHFCTRGGGVGLVTDSFASKFGSEAEEYTSTCSIAASADGSTIATLLADAGILRVFSADGKELANGFAASGVEQVALSADGKTVRGIGPLLLIEWGGPSFEKSWERALASEAVAISSNSEVIALYDAKSLVLQRAADGVETARVPLLPGERGLLRDLRFVEGTITATLSTGAWLRMDLATSAVARGSVPFDQTAQRSDRGDVELRIDDVVATVFAPGWASRVLDDVGAYRFELSPDGSRVAGVSATKLFVFSRTGTLEKEVALDLPPVPPGPVREANPLVAPVGGESDAPTRLGWSDDGALLSIEHAAGLSVLAPREGAVRFHNAPSVDGIVQSRMVADTLVACGASGSVALHDTTTGAVTAVLEEPIPFAVVDCAMVVHPARERTNHRIAIALQGNDHLTTRSLRIWSGEGALLRELPKPEPDFYTWPSLAFSKDGRRLFGVGNGVTTWETETGRVLSIAGTFYDGSFGGAAISKDGRFVAEQSGAGHTHLLSRTWPFENLEVFAVAEKGCQEGHLGLPWFATDSSAVFSSGQGTSFGHSLSGGGNLLRFTHRDLETISNDGTIGLAWAGEEEPRASIWSVTKGKRLRTLPKASNTPRLSPDGRFVAYISGSDVVVEDAASGVEKQRLKTR